MLRTTVTAKDKGFPWIKFGIWVGGTIGLVVISIVAAYVWAGVSSGAAVGATHKFLAAVKSGDTQRAYAYTSSEFRSVQEQSAFDSTLSILALSDYTIDGWTGRVVPKSRGGYDLIRGSISTPSDDNMEFSVTLSEEGGEWKIVSFVDQWREWVGPGAWFKQLPADEVINKLVSESMNSFAAAIQAKDLNGFYNSMSQSFTIKNSLRAFEVANGHLIKNNADLSAVSTSKPTFDPPPKVTEQAFGGGSSGAISGGGGISVGSAGRNTGKAGVQKDTLTLLDIRGHYQEDPNPTIQFQLRYGYDHPGWSLHSIFVDVPELRKK